MAELILSITALVIGILGTFLMYYYSPKTESRTILYQKEELDAILKKDQFKNKMVRFGMLLLFLSFLLQLIALLFKKISLSS